MRGEDMRIQDVTEFGKCPTVPLSFKIIGYEIDIAPLAPLAAHSVTRNSPRYTEMDSKVDLFC